MMSKYKISMIIPTFNVENDLKRAINSLLYQTIGFENLEVILVDDKSTDNTQEIILEYSKKYENIKYLFLEENSGSAGKPRNKGIEIATSDYIMFLDNDDEYVKEACEIFYKKITETNENMIIGSEVNEIYSPNDLQKNQKQIPKFIKKNVLENPDYLYTPFTEYSGAMWCKIFKKEFIVKNNIKCLENLPEDVYFMHQCYYLNPNIIFIKNLKLYNHYFYREIGESVSTTLSSSYLIRGFLSFDKLEELSKQKSNSTKFLNRFFKLVLESFSYLIIVSNGTKDEKYYLIEKYSVFGNKYNIKFESNILIQFWHKLACSNHMKVTLIYTYILNIIIRLKNFILRRKITL